MDYYIQIKNNEILSYSNLPVIDEEVINQEVNETTYNEYIAHTNYYYVSNNAFLRKTNAQIAEEEAQAESERIANLTRSRAEVWRSLIQARRFTSKEKIYERINALIDELPEETEEQRIKKEIARIDVDDVEDFHRGHKLVNLVGEYLEISSENLDLYFETGDYHYLEAEEDV